jgi:hypothetical protein
MILIHLIKWQLRPKRPLILGSNRRPRRTSQSRRPLTIQGREKHSTTTNLRSSSNQQTFLFKSAQRLIKATSSARKYKTCSGPMPAEKTILRLGDRNTLALRSTHRLIIRSRNMFRLQIIKIYGAHLCSSRACTLISINSRS